MFMKNTVAIATLLICTAANCNDTLQATYETVVDKSGNISLPDHFRRDWAFLGTWSIAQADVETSSAASGHGAAGLHNVYTQRTTIDHYRKTGKFLDGAVIVKELLTAVTSTMTTGTASRATEVEGWFVMVKDKRGRFQSNPLWGDGWGWSLFNAGQPDSTVTTNYKTECIGCHIPARKDDWIYVNGYPVLDTKK